MDFIDVIAKHLPDLKTFRKFAVIFPDVTRLLEPKVPGVSLLELNTSEASLLEPKVPGVSLRGFEVLPSGNKKLLLFAGEIFDITEFVDGAKVVESAQWDGVKNGIYREWDHMRRLITEGQYLDNKQHGFWKIHDDEEGIYNEETYDRGKPNGLFVERYDSGQVKRQGNYRNGKREGIFTTYDVDGNITGTKRYINDRLVQRR